MFFSNGYCILNPYISQVFLIFTRKSIWKYPRRHRCLRTGVFPVPLLPLFILQTKLLCHGWYALLLFLLCKRVRSHVRRFRKRRASCLCSRWQRSCEEGREQPWTPWLTLKSSEGDGSVGRKSPSGNTERRIRSPKAAEDESACVTLPAANPLRFFAPSSLTSKCTDFLLNIFLFFLSHIYNYICIHTF